MRTTTIPRLELTSAWVSARVAELLVLELCIYFHRVVLWSDSCIVLHYISNTKARYATFVANIVQRIRKFTCQFTWRYVPSRQNPADIASRGMQDKSELDMWLKGPEFYIMMNPNGR